MRVSDDIGNITNGSCVIVRTRREEERRTGEESRGSRVGRV